MKSTPIRHSLLRLLLCVLLILASFFRSRLLPLSGIAEFIGSAAALVVTVVCIGEIYKAVCSIVNELAP